MTIDQIIALSASVGACASAFATLLTVRQMQQQRESSYRPEIVFSRTVLEGSSERTSGDSLPTNWSKPTDIEGAVGMSTMDSISLRNVGMGAAKNILVSWSFLIEETVNRVNDLAQRTMTPAYFTLENGNLSLKSENLGARTSIWKNQQQESLDYVLPATIQNEPVFINIPPAFILLSSALLFLSTKDADRLAIPEIPLLNARIDYSDIGDNRHSAEFEFNLKIIALIGNGAFHGLMESKKCV